MITCIIIEDQAPAQRILKKFIQDAGNLVLKGTFNDALSAMDCLKTEQIDLVFLDIHLPKLSGMDFLKILHPRPKVILTTAFSDYALDAFELDVIDYLLKPFSFERFVKAISKVNALKSESLTREKSTVQVSEKKEQTIFIKSGHDYIQLGINDINLIKSEGDYTFIYTNDARHFVSYSLKYWSEKLPEDQFCQVHKSFIVQVQSIDKLSGNQISIGEEKVPVGRAYKDYFMKRFVDRS